MVEKARALRAAVGLGRFGSGDSESNSKIGDHLMQIDLTELLHRAFDAGFLTSSRGYNAEYPFSGDAAQVSRELSAAREDAVSELLASVTVARGGGCTGFSKVTIVKDGVSYDEFSSTTKK